MNTFTPHQIVSLFCKNLTLYGEVIQVIESRSALWVRPLLLIVADNFETIDVRKGSDLILPTDLFKPALDTEVLPLFSQVIKDNYIANISYPLQEFVQKVCQNYPEYFQKNLSMIDEGYVKYNCTWIPDRSLISSEIAELNYWRNRLYRLGLIGQYDNGIGFGNVSQRGKIDKEIIISGTNTGGIPVLNESHYTTVIDYDWKENRVTCRGTIAASSETLTHGAIYEANPQINGVIHIHHRPLWQNLMYRVPTTQENIAYGTPEMAAEIIRLCQEERLEEQQILVMSGHEEGIIAFGQDLEKAGNLLLAYYQQSQSS